MKLTIINSLEELEFKKLEQGLKDIKEGRIIKLETYIKKREISIERLQRTI